MKRLFWGITILVAFTLVLAGCSATAPAKVSDDTSNRAATSSYGSDLSEAENSSASITDSAPLKILYNGEASLEADEPDKAMAAIKTEVESLGGYIANSSLSRDENGKTDQVSVELKIPAGKLDGIEAFLGTLGQVKSYKISSSDITSNYYDVQARLTNAQAQQAAYLKMMEKVTTIDEALKVQAAIDDVQERIEVFEGQLRLWDNQTDMSTLTLQIDTPAAIISQGQSGRIMSWSELWTGIRNGIKNACIFIVNFFGWVVIALANLIIPCGIFALIAWPIIHFSKKRRDKAKATKPRSEDETK